MIKHVVLIKLNKGIKQKDVDLLKEKLLRLPDFITEILSFEVGQNILHGERAFDIAVIACFVDIDSYGIYHTHPEHIKVKELLNPMCIQIISADFISDPALKD